MKTNNSNPSSSEYIILPLSSWGNVNEEDFAPYSNKFTLGVRLTPKLKTFMAEKKYPIYEINMGYAPTGNRFHPYRAIRANAIETKLLSEFEKQKKTIKTTIRRPKKNPIVIENNPVLTRFYNTDKYTEFLFHNLREPEIAKIEWLREAYEAFVYSSRNRGIMAGFISKQRDPNDFYPCLLRAMGAHYRHTRTNYDLIDKRGMTEEEVDELRAEYSRNSF